MGNIGLYFSWALCPHLIGGCEMGGEGTVAWRQITRRQKCMLWKFFSWPSIYMSKPLGCWVASYARTTQFQGEERFVFEHAMFSQALFFSLDSETLQHFRPFQAEKSTFDSQEKFGDFKWHTSGSPELIWLTGTWGYHILLLIFLT